MSKQKVLGLLQQQRHPEARDACIRLCKHHPNDAEAWFLLGAIQGQLGNFSDAEGCCRTALTLQPTHPLLHYNLAIALLNQNRPSAAIPHFKEAIRLNPGYAEAHADLGNALQLQGEVIEALACYEQALRYNSNVAPIHFNAGNAHKKLNNREKAIACYRRALQLQPNLTDAYVELGKLLLSCYRYQDVIALMTKAVAILPNSAELPFILGTAHQEQGETDQALACYQCALDIEPGHEGALSSMAGVLGFQGKYQEARALLLPLITRPHPDVTAVIIFGHFAHRYDSEDDAIRLIDSCLLRNDLSNDTRSKLHFALAKIHDRHNNYDSAFENFRSANEYKDAQYSPMAFTRVINALKETFNHDTIERLPRSTEQSDLPVFVVGMPRSGTSLVEQILASHPMVFGAGELHAINDLVLSLPATLHSDLPYPLCIKSGTQEAFTAVARQYIDDLSDRSGGGMARVTDKMPHNFLHLGLIDLLFPGARIIHCLRDPLDTCLSCYFHNFSGEHAYAYNLDSLGTYYRQYERLMAHWRSVIRIPMLEVRYEDVVSNTEEASRILVDFCGLPWDDRCLRFHESQRTVATASHDQVRRPIYHSSVGRWKHYEAFLEPLKAALGREETSIPPCDQFTDRFSL